MKLIGKIRDFTVDFLTKKQLLTVEIDGDVRELVDRLKDKKLSVDLNEFREKRSLTANGYYWSLVHKISEINGVSDAWTHNLYLRDCRCLDTIAGENIAVTIPDTDEAERQVLNREDYHLLPTSKTKEGKDGTLRYYLKLRGSSDMDSKEFSRLLDFAVQDASEMGIPTISDQETQRLMEMYGR